VHIFYWVMKNVFIGPFLRRVFRPWLTGMENVPKKGGAILASNHLSFIDSIILPVELERRISFLAKAEYFTGKGLKGWAIRSFMLATGQLPIDRSGGKASEAALTTGLSVLRRGELLGIYPEGTRSGDGRLYRGRTGIARMVLEGQVPVIPVAMIDTEKAMPIGSRLPKVHRIGIVIGKPLDFSRFAGLEGDRFILRSITDEIMYELAKLSGQEYVDVYASSVKGAVGSPLARPAAR
jgi:1-acyl-sn-glycerol-3-phosphate acyltransferase